MIEREDYVERIAGLEDDIDDAEADLATLESALAIARPVVEAALAWEERDTLDSNTALREAVRVYRTARKYGGAAT